MPRRIKVSTRPFRRPHGPRAGRVLWPSARSLVFTHVLLGLTLSSRLLVADFARLLADFPPTGRTRARRATRRGNLAPPRFPLCRLARRPRFSKNASRLKNRTWPSGPRLRCGSWKKSLLEGRNTIEVVNCARELSRHRTRRTSSLHARVSTPRLYSAFFWYLFSVIKRRSRLV